MKIVRDLLKYIFTHEDKNDYRRIRVIDVPVHRIAGTLKQGRLLQPGEVVHHKNLNKHDNRLSNLQIFKNQSAHMKYHWKLKKKQKRK